MIVISISMIALLAAVVATRHLSTLNNLVQGRLVFTILLPH